MMKFIDSWQHSHLGDLFGLPLMHPIDSINDDLNSNNLFLGGRFGEHSAFVIKDIPGCLDHYIAFRFGKRLSPYPEFTNDWTISECYEIYPQIKSFMDKIGVSSPELAIILAVGDYVFSLASAFHEHLGLISETLFERASEIPIEPWNLVNVPAKPGVLGRVDLAGGTVLGISLVEEIKYFDQIRPVVSISQISEMEGAAIAANTNMKIMMRKEP